MSYINCIKALTKAAGRDLSDDEVRAVYERVHKAALDIKAGRAEPSEVGLSKTLEKKIGVTGQDAMVQAAAERAARELIFEAETRERQAHLQVTALSKMAETVKTHREAGLAPLDAVEKTIVRDFSGRVNTESLEQRVKGYQSYFGAKINSVWNALGEDWLGYFQDRQKLKNVVMEMLGEDSGDALAKKGAKAFHDAAEEARQVYNAAGGKVGKLDESYLPQGWWDQSLVATIGRDKFIEFMTPILKKTQSKGKYYVDDLGNPWDDARMTEFVGKAWDTIATDGIANREPGQYKGPGKRANRHAEHRQIHFPDAESTIQAWEMFGGKSFVEIVNGHIEGMARDIAFIEKFGPNPDTTYRTIRDMAVRDAVMAEPTKLDQVAGRAHKMDLLYEYASGKTKPSANLTVSRTMDGIANLNAAGKLGGAAVASFFGDKPMYEAVSHLNDLPVIQRWRTEISLLNPANGADRALLQQQGLMLEGVRSGLSRFYEGMGSHGWTGKISNAVMRVTGMTAINDIRKGAFGLNLMHAIGKQIKSGVDFNSLDKSDIRTLRNFGITEADWSVWRLAKLQDLGKGNDSVLTPESISMIPDEALKGIGDPKKVRRDAIVKLLGAVNTESEFAVVTPGWKERAAFYGDLQRGTVKGEIARSVLQFKSFPWTMLMRSMDAVANSTGPGGKAAMTAYLVVSTTLAGAMLMQTREMLSGKDPRSMTDENWNKFWMQAFLQGGALGIYADFIKGASETRYGSGILETMAGPTIGPILEMGLIQPLKAVEKKIQGKETNLAAQTLQDLKGFVPGSNIWFLKAATDHLIWQQAMELLSPGYNANVRMRTMKDYRQDWWWEPGETIPQRAPAISEMLQR